MDTSKIINKILKLVRDGADMKPVLHYGCEALTTGLGATRCVVWTVVDDQLEATEEFATGDQYCFRENKLSPWESTAVVIEFLSRFPDASGSGSIYIADTAEDSHVFEPSRTILALLELADVRSRLLGQLRTRGIFSGFVDLQKCRTKGHWAKAEAQAFEEVTVALSIAVQQSFDMRKLESGTRDLRLIHEIGSIFDKAEDSKNAWKKASSLLASHMGFEQCQIYLFEERDGVNVLVPQVNSETNEILNLTISENPFVEAFFSRVGKIYNATNGKGTARDPVFGGEMAFLHPFKANGEQLGVFGLWQRQPSNPPWVPQHHELCLTVARLFGVYAKSLPL